MYLTFAEPTPSEAINAQRLTSQALMHIQFLAKRRYTNKDTLLERFGRCYRLPLHWAHAGHLVSLDLIDYRGLRYETARDGTLRVRSVPAWRGISALGFPAASRQPAPDLVVASGDCLLGLAGARVASLCGAKFVFDVYDDYRTFGSYRAFLGLDIYNRLLRKADQVLYASEALATMHDTGTRYSLTPNGVDTALFKPIPIEAALQNLGLTAEGVSRVGYFGSMERDRGVNVLIAAIGLLRGEGLNVRLMICGMPNPETPLNEPWIDYAGMVPHRDVPNHIGACDVVALPYLRSALMDAGASCKIAEYMFCRRPIAATRTPNLQANFPSQALALQSHMAIPGDASDLARVIKAQLEHPIIVEPPTGMDWESIAKKTLDDIMDRRST
jgi:glycosyltransferase involved in cell wall biosynthesis